MKDYIYLQKELVQSKRDYLKAKSDLEKRSAAGGDQTELRETREELDRLKARLGNQQLGQITNQLDSVEQIAQLSDKNRDLQRRNTALEKRLEECESLLD